MKTANVKSIKNHLHENDFHIDPLGRMVIDNPEILSAINGGMGGNVPMDDSFLNGSCSNSQC